MEAETLLLRRQPTETAPRLTLDEMWPVRSAGAWPEGLTVRREHIYQERI